MSAVLSEAETKFFSSRGQEVDASLSTPDPAPAETPDPAPAAAPTASQAKAPDAPPPTAVEPPKQPDAKPGHVPLEALHAERRQRQEIEQQFKSLQKQWGELQQAIQQAGQPVEERPNPEEDPYGALAYDNQKLRQQLEELGTRFGQQEQAQTQRQALASFTQRVNASEAAFRATHPDYDAAAAHAIQQYDKFLSASFPDPAERRQQIQLLAANELSRVVKAGGDPANFVYNFAKSMGYMGPAPANPSGGTPAPATPVAPAPPVSEVVQKIEKGLKQQTNLSAGGSTPPSEMTPEMLAAISDPAEFNKQWDKAFKKRG